MKRDINLGFQYIIFSVAYILINSIVSDVNTQFSLHDILTLYKTPALQYCLFLAYKNVVL